ncbi:MAG TPA: phospholipase D-like domain-containing protein [Candidatus Saccharimonadales bacterium]|jgi:phosphatidylserine/phosphatidylglycerophosphate/cardiolipin synthase-like enzyme
MNVASLTVYETAAYFQKLLQLVTATERDDRVALATMSFDPGDPPIGKLVDELIAAAKRGVRVQLLVDALSFSLNRRDVPTGPTMFKRAASSSKRPYFRQKYLLLERLKAAGGEYRVINFPNRRLGNPYASRSHIKAAIINDTAFVGGCNLSRSSQFDYMVRLEDKTTVAWLYELLCEISSNGSVRRTLQDTDRELAIDPITTLFVDAGKPKQSIIYEKALEFIDSAQEWLVMTCQFFPNTVTAKHLAAAHRRGVKIKLYYNHPHWHAAHMRLVHHAVILGERTRRPTILFEHQLPKTHRRLHAKLLASEQGAIIGSHNYVTHGVNFGTAEIALLRRDLAFALEATRAIEDRIEG